MQDKISELFPDDRSQYQSNTEKMQHVLLRLISIFDHICTTHDLEYWIDGGTLLGAIRHKGFIPWDDDIDVCMPEKDYYTFLEQAPKYLGNDLLLLDGEHCQVLNKGAAKLYDLKSSSKQLNARDIGILPSGFFIDIFCMESHSNKIKDTKRIFKYARTKLKPDDSAVTALKKRIRMFFNRHIAAEKVISKSRYAHGEYLYYTCRWFSYFLRRSYIYPIKSVPFENLHLRAPNDAHHYLQDMYGDYMTPPDSAERGGHFSECYPEKPDSNFYPAVK